MLNATLPCHFPAPDAEGEIKPLIPTPKQEWGGSAPVELTRPVSILEGLDTVAEFCAFLRISRTTFYNLKKKGFIRPLKVGRKTLVPRSEREAFLCRVPQPLLFPEIEQAS
jgi:excisionase family DNA binding protein